MASAKQVAANRANAKLSAGPKSASGKARSRMNSWRHGLAATTVVVGNEDPVQFEALCAELERDFKPRSGLSRQLVERLATLLWRLRRVPTLEAAILVALRANKPTLSVADEETRKKWLTELAKRYLPKLQEEEEEEKSVSHKPATKPVESPPTVDKGHDDLKLIGLTLISDQHQDALVKLSRYEASLMNGLAKTFQMLDFIQRRESVESTKL